MKFTTLVLASSFAVCACTAAPSSSTPPTAGLEVRFCPGTVARSYPLDSVRGVQGLVLQNAVVINHGTAVELESLEIALMSGGEALDSRLIRGDRLAALAATGAALQASGALELFSFQFCGDRLLNGAKLTDDLTLETGEALLLMHQPFSWSGERDALRITARSLGGASALTGHGSIPIDGASSATHFRFPLKSGTWLVVVGASFHTPHRWAVPEEFALDIIQLGPNLRSHRTDGATHSDYFAYGAEVVAAADGTVAEVINGGKEHPPQLRRAGESMDDYYGRIGAQQAENLMAGPSGVVGDCVILDHGHGEFSTYAHLKPGSITVRSGQVLKAGDTLGLLGSSGNSTEAHLHFQVTDRPAPLDCAGLVPTFVGFEIANSDGPRPLQSGDLVIVP